MSEDIKPLLPFESKSPRLSVRSPIGKSGDTILELQVRCAGNPTIRQRIVSDAIKEPVGSDKHITADITLRRQKVKSFLKLAGDAAKSGDPVQARQALEDLSLIKNGFQHMTFFSTYSQQASMALARLEVPHNPERIRNTHSDFENQLRHRRFIGGLLGVVGIATPIIKIVTLRTGKSPANEDITGAMVFLIAFCIFYIIGFYGVRQQDRDTKQLMEELFVIAKNNTSEPP